MIFLYIFIYISMIAVTAGAMYAEFTDNYPSLDSPRNRRYNLSWGILYGLVWPMSFITAFFLTGFFYHGIRWTGGPRR